MNEVNVVFFVFYEWPTMLAKKDWVGRVQHMVPHGESVQQTLLSRSMVGEGKVVESCPIVLTSST
jgi:hypothetical protein